MSIYDNVCKRLERFILVMEGVNMKKMRFYLSVFLLFCLFCVPIYSSNQYVYLGGDSVAMILKYDGVLVTGRFPFEYKGKTLQPNEFEIKQNDMIISVNNHRIHSIDDFYNQLEIYTDEYFEVPITISRKQKVIDIHLDVSYKEDNQMYKTGLYLKDELNGVGTITYYNPSNRTFAALGHNIVERSQTDFVHQNGYLFYSSISSFSKSRSNSIGEKHANISSGEIGRITKSNNYGVYGNYSINVNDKELIQLSNKNDVILQEAYIYTVLYGTTVERFTIQILEIYPNSPSKEKGITFRITDKRLLELTGGIIQGMSGSPIVQNGKLVGAVTHVLVNDPTRGYGIFIENMLEAAK